MKIEVPVAIVEICTAMRADTKLTDDQRATLKVWLLSVGASKPAKAKAPRAHPGSSHSSWEAVLAERPDWRIKYASLDGQAFVPTIEEELARAWDHTARKKANDMGLYLGGWLRRACADAATTKARAAKAGVHTATTSSMETRSASPTLCRCGSVLSPGAKQCRDCSAPTAEKIYDDLTPEEKEAGRRALDRLRVQLAPAPPPRQLPRKTIEPDEVHVPQESAEVRAARRAEAQRLLDAERAKQQGARR